MYISRGLLLSDLDLHDNPRLVVLCGTHPLCIVHESGVSFREPNPNIHT